MDTVWGTVWPAVRCYQLNALCPPFDVQAANALLDQSGWVKGLDGVWAEGVYLAKHKKLVHIYTPGPEGAAEDNMVWIWWCDGGHC